MALSNDLNSEVSSIFQNQWESTAGYVIPLPTDVGLGNKAKHLQNAVVLYADLDGLNRHQFCRH